jgi:mRNA interferase MazF
MARLKPQRAAGVRRGDVVWVALDPTIGTEIQKTRPAIVVSNDAMNRFGQRVIVVPLTGHVDHCFAGEAVVTIKGKPNRALGDQMRSVDKARLRGRLDRLSPAEVRAVDQALITSLALEL